MDSNDFSVLKKAKGSRNGALSGHSIYFDDRQLLIVETGLLHEKYRKVAYDSICGYSISESNRRMVIGLIVSVLAIIFLFSSIADDFNSPGLWISCIFFALLAGINTYKGQGCKCTLTTAYSSIPLKSLKRVKKARIFKSFLDEKITEIQGILTPEEIIEKEKQRSLDLGSSQTPSTPGVTVTPLNGEDDLDENQVKESETSSEPPVSSPIPPVAFSTATPPPIRFGNPPDNRHKFFPWVALAFAFSSALSFLFPGYPSSITMLLFAGALIGTTITLSKKVGTTGGATIGGTARWALGIYITEVVIGYIAWIVILSTNQFSNPGEVYSSNVYEMTPGNTGFFKVLHGMNTIINAGLSFIYFSALKKSSPKRSD